MGDILRQIENSQRIEFSDLQAYLKEWHGDPNHLIAILHALCNRDKVQESYMQGYQKGYQAGHAEGFASANLTRKEYVKVAPRSKRERRTGEEYSKAIREVLDQYKKATMKEIFTLVGGTPATVLHALKALEEARIVRCQGKGKRGSPRIYELYPEARNITKVVIRRTDGMEIRKEMETRKESGYPLGAIAKIGGGNNGVQNKIS